MAIANLLIKFGADISELKVGSDKALATLEKTGAKIDSIGSSIKATLLSAFTVGAVVSFGQELLRMGDDIVRTADRTGLLTDEVQQLSFIASQSGNSLDELTRSIGQMQNRLAGSDRSAVAAVDFLKLSFDKLRNASPYEQMATLAEAIGKVENPAKRAELAMDLFGRTGIAILPTLTAQFKALGDEAPKMSENTVRALDQLGDAFDFVKLQMKVWVAEAYNGVGKAFDWLNAEFYKMVAGFYAGIVKLLVIVSKIPGSSRIFGDLDSSIKSLSITSLSYSDTAKSLEFHMSKTTTTARKAVPAFVSTADAVDKASGAHKRAKPPLDAHAAALKKTTEAAEAFTMDLTNNMIPVVQQLGTQIEMVTPTVEQFGMNMTNDMIPQAVARLGTEVAIVMPTVDKEVRRASDGVDVFAQSIAQLGHISSGSFGEIVRSIGTVTAAFKQVSHGFAALKEGKAEGGGSGTMGMIGGLAMMATGYGAVAMAAIAAGKAIFKAMNDGRKAVVDFATSAGGFDDLRQKLLVLGEEGDRLWVKLTQGTKKGDKSGAQAVIEEITAALDKQGTQAGALNGIMEEYGFTWEDLGEKARGAKLGELFDTLFEKTQILKGAGIDYSEILKRQSTDYSDLVQAAMRTGSEIPIAMKPVLQDLIAMGTLVDASGAAFTDLSQVTFAKSLTQGFDQVTLAIKEVSAVLTNVLGGALDALGRKVVTVPIKFDVDDIPGGGDVPGFAGGTRGKLLNFGSGRLVALHGKEGVYTEQDVKDGLELGTGTASGDTHITLTAPDFARLLRGEMIDVARKDAAIGGLKTRAGRGRSK